MSHSSEFRTLVERFSDVNERERPSFVQSDFHAKVLGLLLEARIPALTALAEATLNGEVTTSDGGLRARAVPSPNLYRSLFRAMGEGLPVGGVLVSIHRKNEPDPGMDSFIADFFPEKLSKFLARSAPRSTEPGEGKKVCLYLPNGDVSVLEVVEADATGKWSLAIVGSVSDGYEADTGVDVPQAINYQLDSWRLIEPLDRLVNAVLRDWKPVMREDSKWRKMGDKFPASYVASEAAALHAVRSSDMRAGPEMEAFLREMEEIWVAKSGAQTHANLVETLTGLKAGGHLCYANRFIFDDLDSCAWCEDVHDGRDIMFLEDQNRRHVVLLREGDEAFHLVTLGKSSNARWPSAVKAFEKIMQMPDVLWTRAGDGEVSAFVRSIRADAVKSLSSLESIAGSAVCALEDVRPVARM